MNKIEILIEKIEALRSDLNQAITDGLPSEEIYKKSVALDQLIEQYMDITC